jgi:hypothetical protein
MVWSGAKGRVDDFCCKENQNRRALGASFGIDPAASHQTFDGSQWSKLKVPLQEQAEIVRWIAL